eukprot:5310237-Prymnesium_polylepis.2
MAQRLGARLGVLHRGEGDPHRHHPRRHAQRVGLEGVDASERVVLIVGRRGLQPRGRATDAELLRAPLEAHVGHHKLPPR